MYHPKRRSKTTQLNQVLSAREEVTEIPNWGRELSVIDMLKGSDGHVYKGRFKQAIPPIAKNTHSPHTNMNLHPLPRRNHSLRHHHARTQAQLATELSSGAGKRNNALNCFTANPAEELSREPRYSPRETHPTNQSRNTSPRTRMRHIVKRHSSDSPPVPIPSPSPPTVRENETLKGSQKQQRLGESQDSQSKLFTPAAPRPSPDGAGESDEIDPGGTGSATGMECFLLIQSIKMK
ncbi:hypothetical protein OS493_003801 [Desmophyllum pertusum]|uniref:Uncharacterized protein n=1 Tax=Desmophyllum pertusum TaxID=174260 RepID=A0A9X0DCW7_9CNID|nr:hypothetical protein OS493_003801 [Desmophyllum pertusum]